MDGDVDRAGRAVSPRACIRGRLRTWTLVAAVSLLTVACGSPRDDADTSMAPTPSRPSAPTVTPAVASQSVDPEPPATSTDASTAPTPTQDPGAPRFAVPNGVLPPTADLVAVRPLDLYAMPDQSSRILRHVEAGERLSAGPAWMVNGVRWQELWRAPPTFRGYARLSETLPEVEVVPVVCPVGPFAADTLIDLSGWERLACFGGLSVTFEAQEIVGFGGYIDGSREPRWLAWELGSGFAVTSIGGGESGLMLAVEPGTVDLTRPEVPSGSQLGAVLRVSGHMNHPTSPSCSISGQVIRDAAGHTVTGDMASDSAVLLCRQRFVLTAFEVVAAGP